MNDFNDYLNEQLKDPDFKKEWDDSESEYSLARSFLMARKECNMTQKELARKVGVSEKAVINWELDCSNPTARNMLALADIFSVSMDALYGREERAAADLSGLRDHKRKLIEVMINAAIQYTRQHDSRSNRPIVTNMTRHLEKPAQVW